MKKICTNCRKRPAKAVSRQANARHGIGQKKNHDLCRQCFESQRDSNRGLSLSGHCSISVEGTSMRCPLCHTTVNSGESHECQI